MLREKFRIVAVAALVLALVSAGCAGTMRAQPQLSRPLLERAIITPEDVDESIRDEAALSANYERLPGNGEPWFLFLDGCREVLITAPHATNPMREGKLRFADLGTGALAMALHRLSGAQVMYTSLASPSDPNYYDDNEFKATLANVIADRQPLVVIDLHGSHTYRPYDVDFGTMAGRALVGREDLLLALADALRREGLTNQSQDFFSAEKNRTITKWVAARNVPCIQLEISSTWLRPAESGLAAHRYAQLLQGLVRFVRSMGCMKKEAPLR